MWHEGICLPDIVAETLELRHDNCIKNGLRTGRSPGSEILGKRYRKSLVFFPAMISRAASGLFLISGNGNQDLD